MNKKTINNSNLYIFLKKFLPQRIKNYYFYYIRDFYENIRINIAAILIPKFIVSIKDRSGKKMFTLRNFGNSTASRGYAMFRSDPEVCEWIDKIPENSNFLDVGANVGVYSLYAAHLKNTVVSLEPESLNFACLNLNISDNNFNDKIFSYPFCAHDTVKISDLNISRLRFGGSGHTFDRTIMEDGKSFIPSHKQGSISVRLDDFLKEIKFIPHFIKIDVDGNELNTINGMTDSLTDKNLRSICIELDPEFHEHKKVIDILNNSGFTKCRKYTWYEGQTIFNYVFDR